MRRFRIRILFASRGLSLLTDTHSLALLPTSVGGGIIIIIIIIIRTCYYYVSSS